MYTYPGVLEMGLSYCFPREKIWGHDVVILNALTPQCFLGGGWDLAQTCIRREQYVTTTGAGLRLPNSQPAWGDNI